MEENPLPNLFEFLNDIETPAGMYNLAGLIGSIANQAETLYGGQSMGVAFGGHVIAEANIGNMKHAFLTIDDGTNHLVKNFIEE